MKMVPVSVLLDDIKADHFAEIVALCETKGLVVERQMFAVGVISGIVEASKIPELEKVCGVRHVEESHDVHVLPKPLKS